MIEVFPVATADGDVLGGKGLGEKIRANGFFSGAEPSGQHTKAVFSSILRKLCTDDGGDGGHDIRVAGELIAGLVRFDFTGPTHEKWHAMAALPLIAFDPAPGVGGIVLVIGAHVYGTGDFGAVVASKDDDGVIGNAELGECLHQLADDPVEL